MVGWEEFVMTSSIRLDVVDDDLGVTELQFNSQGTKVAITGTLAHSDKIHREDPINSFHTHSQSKQKPKIMDMVFMCLALLLVGAYLPSLVTILC